MSLFIISSIILILAPGPDILFLITHSLRHGLKAGLSIALGLASGNLFHTLAAALGVTIVIQALPNALTVIQYLGAAYLLYLAYRAIFPKKSTASDTELQTPSHRSFFIRGILMNILNPKVGLFFIAFLPQFVPGDTQQPQIAMISLGFIFTALVIIIFSSIAFLVSTLKKQTPLHTVNHRYFDWLCAAVFITLSLHLLSKSF